LRVTSRRGKERRREKEGRGERKERGGKEGKTPPKYIFGYCLATNCHVGDMRLHTGYSLLRNNPWSYSDESTTVFGHM